MKKTGATTFWELADKKALPKETINYVPTILAFAIIGRDPGQYGFNVEPNPPLETERVELEKATDLRVIAENLGLPVDQVKELNPHVLRWTTPPDDSEFELILPKGYSEKFQDKVANLPEKERILWRYHNVKKGETLSVIARNYGVAVNDLTQANRISVKTSLKIGQEILIPMSGASRAPTPSAPASASKTKVAAKPTPAPSTSYKVKRGDTLTGIAAKFNLTVIDLQKWNKLTSTRLDIGQKLALAPPRCTAGATEEIASILLKTRASNARIYGSSIEKSRTSRLRFRRRKAPHRTGAKRQSRGFRRARPEA